MTSPNTCVINMSAAIHPPIVLRRFVFLLVLLLSTLFYTHVAPLCDALPLPRIGGATQNSAPPSDASISINGSPTTSSSNAPADIMPMRLLFQTVHRVLNNLHSDGMVISTRLPVPSSEANRHLQWHSKSNPNPNPNPYSYSNSNSNSNSNTNFNSNPSRPDDHRPRGSKSGIHYHDVDVNFLDSSDGSVAQENRNSNKKADIYSFDASTPDVAVSQSYKNRSFALVPAWFNASDVTTRFVRGLNQSIVILTPLVGPTTNLVRSMSHMLGRAFNDSRRWLSARWSAYNNNYKYDNNIDSSKSKLMVDGGSMGTASLDRSGKDGTVSSSRTGRNNNTAFERGGTGAGELHQQRHGDNDVRHNSYYKKDFSASSSSSEQERAAHSMISQSNTHPYSFAHPYQDKSGSGTTGSSSSAGSSRSSNIYQHAEDRQQQHVYGHSESYKPSTSKTDGHVRIVSRNATAIIVRIDTDLPPFGSGRGSASTSASAKHDGKHRHHHQHGNREAHPQGSMTKATKTATKTSSSSSSSSTADAKHKGKNWGGDGQQDEKGKPITNFFPTSGKAEHKDNSEPVGDGGGGTGTGTGGVMQRRRADAATTLVDADAAHDDDDMKSDVDVGVDIDVDAYWEADSDSQDADDSELDMDVSMSLKTHPTLVVSANVMNNVVWVQVDHGNGLVAHHRIDLHPSKEKNDNDNNNRSKDDDRAHGHDDSVTVQHQQQFHEVIDAAHIVIESLDSNGYTLVIPRRVYANAVAAAGREEDDERFLSAQLECQRRFGSSGIRRMLCTCDELHAAIMTTTKATTTPKTTPVSTPTTMSRQDSVKTVKSNVTSADSSSSGSGSGGSSSDSLTGTKKKKGHGGSMKMKTTNKTAKTDTKLNNNRITSNPGPNSKSSSHSASTSSQQQKRQQKQPWEQDDRHQQLLQAIATNRRRLLCKARIADRVIRTAYRVGAPLVAASVRSHSVDCRQRHDPHHKHRHGHGNGHGLEEGDKTVLQAEQCLSAVLNAVAGEHSSFHQSHGRGILATTTGFDIDRAISQRGRKDREKRKRKGSGGGGSGHDNRHHETHDDVGRLEKTLSWADDDDDADGMTAADVSHSRPYAERRRGARAQRDRVMNDNMSIMRMIQQLHPWHWASGGGSRANAGDDDDGWTKPTKKGQYRQRERQRRLRRDDDDDDRRSKNRSRMNGRDLRYKYDDMGDGGDSDSDVEQLQEPHRLQLQQHHRQQQQQQQGGVFMWMVRAVVMLAYITAVVLLLLCVVDLAWQMRLRWGGRRGRWSADGGATGEADAAKKKKKKTSDLSANTSQAHNNNNSSSNRDKSGKVGSSNVNSKAVSSRSRAKGGRDQTQIGRSSSRKHGHGKKQQRGRGGRGDVDGSESGGGGLLGRVRKSASRVWGWGSWQ